MRGTSTSDDPGARIVALHATGAALDLGTLELCVLAALHLKAERLGAAAFPEDALVETVAQVVELTRTASDGELGARRRASAVLRRLREQRLLVRVDGAGVVRQGEYALSRLATGIVTFFLEDEALTRESLDVLVGALQACLAEVRAALPALAGAPAEAWRAQVEQPLAVSLVELARGIERRQRGFDLQQEVFQREIGALLAADWFGAVERCTSLLDTTSALLAELHDLLLRHAHRLTAALFEIVEAAAAAGAGDAERAARAGCEQIERIAAWGGARQRAWSDYHEWVHRYLRDVVRLDPSRVLAHRLREQLAGEGPRYALVVANAPSIRLLREDLVEPPSAPVRRPKRERDVEPEPEAPQDPDAELRGRIRDALAAGARGLAEVTTRASDPAAPLDARFRIAGRVAELVASTAELATERERPWLATADDLVVEEWGVTPRDADGVDG